MNQPLSLSTRLARHLPRRAAQFLTAGPGLALCLLLAACGGGGGSGFTTTTATANSNVTALVVDAGPVSGNAINAPYVSVKICRPGSTTCQTIDHILVDTGSYGLRLISTLDSALALPSVATPSGVAAGECAQFVSGYAWGSVRQADVSIGGETASAVSVHVIGDKAAAFATPPNSCTNTGSDLGTVAALGANGILGLGLFKQDCGDACANSAITGAYYACDGSTCVNSRMPLASQVSNPAASFAVNNNGVIVSLPSVAGGGVSSLTGSLIFGVGTQSNNSMSGATVYRTNSSGNFTTTYKGVALQSSFIDTGSNGLFFDDSSIPDCSSGNGFFCPGSTALNLSAINASYDGATSGTVNFTIEDISLLSNSITAASIGGSFGSVAGTTGSTLANGVFDWGLPFFYGRKVYVVYEDATAGGATGPFWAY